MVAEVEPGLAAGGIRLAEVQNRVGRNCARRFRVIHCAVFHGHLVETVACGKEMHDRTRIGTVHVDVIHLHGIVEIDVSAWRLGWQDRGVFADDLIVEIYRRRDTCVGNACREIFVVRGKSIVYPHRFAVGDRYFLAEMHRIGGGAYSAVVVDHKRDATFDVGTVREKRERARSVVHLVVNPRRLELETPRRGERKRIAGEGDKPFPLEADRGDRDTGRVDIDRNIVNGIRNIDRIAGGGRGTIQPVCDIRPVARPSRPHARRALGGERHEKRGGDRKRKTYECRFHSVE